MRTCHPSWDTESKHRIRGTHNTALILILNNDHYLEWVFQLAKQLDWISLKNTTKEDLVHTTIQHLEAKREVMSNKKVVTSDMYFHFSWYFF